MTYEIYVNDRLYRTVTATSQPAMNMILEQIQLERISLETNLDQEYRLDLGCVITVKKI